MSDDRLSGLLDGELADHERTELEAELETSDELRRELAELEATRALLRALPAVEPRRPIDDITAEPAFIAPSRSRRTGRLGVAVAAVAAIWLLVFTVGVSVGSLPIVPDVDQLAVQHAAASESAMPMPFKVMDADEMMKDDPAIMEDLGHGMALDAVYQYDDLVQSRYSDGDHVVSVFHEPGSVDWEAMPDMGETSMMEDDTMVWRGSIGDVDVVVTERGDLVVTVVSDGDMDDDMAMVASTMVPEVDSSPSWWSRLKDAPGNLLDRL